LLVTWTNSFATPSIAGQLKGRRIIRGREEERTAWYEVK
jgi:hypothetical protein